MIVAFLNFLGMVWIENIWCVFRVKIPFSSFRSGAVRREPYLTNGRFVHTSLRTEKEKNYNYEGCWFSAIALKALWTEKNPTEFGNKLWANHFVFRLSLHAFYKWSRDDQMRHNYYRHFRSLGRLLEFLHPECLINYLQLHHNFSHKFSESIKRKFDIVGRPLLSDYVDYWTRYSLDFQPV